MEDSNHEIQHDGGDITMKKTQAKVPATPEWRDAVIEFEKPSMARSVGQLANSVVPYFAILVAMYYSLGISYWITLVLAVPAAGFLIRSFIICHDCGHGAFFKSRRANRIFGALTGVLVFIPAYYWSHQHAKHHATAGDLDRRGSGDVWTLTVEEYVALSRRQRLVYRLYRHPLVLLGIGPAYTFFLRYRWWVGTDSPRARRSTIRTNIALALIIVAASLTIGFKAYLMIQLPIMLVAGALGVWLFYVQHQFEGAYWARHTEWSYVEEALDGSSFYDLPRILHWFTGNIGFHHVHHLSPRIPNYYLRACHESSAIFKRVKHIGLRASLNCLGFRLWDEEHRRLVGFGYVPVFLEKHRARGAQALAPGKP
jgi:omega-6 fatty acid desaturase (delta-12 desaturase)